MDPHNPLHRAIIATLEGGAPEKVWKVGEAAADSIRYGTRRNPFAGLVVATWPVDE